MVANGACGGSAQRRPAAAQPAAIHTRRHVEGAPPRQRPDVRHRDRQGRDGLPQKSKPNIAKDVAMLREVLVSPERRDGSKAIAAKRGLLALAV
jgi:hypothetical protein